MLFEPTTVGSLTIKNRIIRSATAERLASEVEGAPKPHLAVVYEELARGGVGTIITGHCYVHRDGKAHQEMASLAGEPVVDVWATTIAPAQEAGAVVIAQLNHSGASANHIINPYSQSPSGIRTNPENPPRTATEEEILAIIRAFGRAADRAKRAGFDGIQIHAAHGYLISQFLSPELNRRSDNWGGSAEKRRRFGVEVVRAVRESVGDDYPVWVKLGVADRAVGGLTPDVGADAAGALAEAGADLIEVSHGFGVPESLSAGEAPFEELAAKVRTVVGPEFPLSVVNGLRTPGVCERLLQAGIVDCVSLCRPFIADRNLVARWKAGGQNPVACVRCDRCWPEQLGNGVRCNNAAVRRAVAGV